MKIDVLKNTIHGTVWGVIVKITAMLLPFIIRTIIIRKLGAEYSGLNGLFSSIINVLNLAELGIGAATVFAMYEPVADDDYVKLSAILNYYKKIYQIIGILVLSSGLLLLPFVGKFINGNVPDDINIYVLYLIYLLNSVCTYFFFAYYSSILYAYQRQADISRIMFYVYSVLYMLQIIVLLLFGNYYLYVVLLPISALFYNYLVYIFVRKKYPNIIAEGNINREDKKKIKKNVVALAINKLGNTIPHTTDTIVISSALGLVSVAAYDNYYYILNSVTGILIIIFNALTAGIGNRLLKNSAEENAKDFSFILYLNAFAVVICTTCMFNMCQDFVRIWVGESLVMPFSLMCLFCVYFFVHMIKKTVTMYRDAAGMWMDIVFMNFASSAVNLALDIVLVKYWGLYGVILPTILCAAFINIPWEALPLFRKKIDYSAKIYFCRIIWYTVIALLSCVVSHFGISILNINNIYYRIVVSMLLSVLLSVITFGVLTMCMDENVKKIVTIVKKYLSQRGA